MCCDSKYLYLKCSKEAIFKVKWVSLLSTRMRCFCISFKMRIVCVCFVIGSVFTKSRRDLSLRLFHG